MMLSLIMQDNRFDGIPLILETINPDIWAEELPGCGRSRPPKRPESRRKKGRIGPLLRLYYAAFQPAGASSGRFTPRKRPATSVPAIIASR